MGHTPTTDAPEVDYNIRYKPVTTAPQTPNEPQGRDTLQTPNYAVDLLIPFIPKDTNVIWEPACGDGKIVFRLEEYTYGVYASDIRFNPEICDSSLNFISDPAPEVFEFYTNPPIIITNPPYSIKEMFIDKAMEYGVP